MNGVDSALLIVDDNEDNRYTLTRRLNREGYTNLTTAVDGRQALELLQVRRFDLVLLDIMMPELNGYQVLEHFVASPELRQIPVIMISALDEMDSIIRCIELGAEDYLAKPFNPTLLRARVGASLEKKRLRDEIMRHMKRMERELETAREIQLSMVPTDFPVPTMDQPLALWATLQPAREIGGDLYDFFWVTPGRLCMVVADVSDKGAPAALFMARAKTVIRLLAKRLAGERAPGAAELVALANQELCRDNPHRMFVTLLLAQLDTATGALEWCNAGHGLPYVIGQQGTVTQIDGVRGKPVGIREEFRYESATRQLEPGEVFLIYTDGVTEAMNEAGDLYGEPRLQASLRSLGGDSPEALVLAVLRDVRAFAGTAPASDDIAALACRWRQSNTPDLFEIAIINDPRELARVSALADRLASINQLSPDLLADLHIALDETLTNIMKYAYADEGIHEIRVRLSIDDGILEVKIEDDGVPFDPLAQPEPELSVSLRERRVGGLGIHFIRKLMSEVAYARVMGGNRLIMRRRLVTNSEGDDGTT